MDGVVAEAAVSFDGDGDEVGVWITASFVLFTAFRGVVGVWCGVGSGGGLGKRVGDADVDVVGGCFVVCDDIHDGAFVGAVEFGDMDFELRVVAVVAEPLLEDAGKGVVAVYTVASGAACGGMLGVVVEWV